MQDFSSRASPEWITFISDHIHRIFESPPFAVNGLGFGNKSLLSLFRLVFSKISFV